MNDKIKQWYFFGCSNESKGHYLFGENLRQVYEQRLRGLGQFDGVLAPQSNHAPYKATVSRLPGWGMSALAFWDYSIDQRPLSNAIVFAPSLTIDPRDLLYQAAQHFPSIWTRFPSVEVLTND